jgi:iron complex outermembrane receptor protein
MLCSLNSARTKAYLLSSVAILSVSTLSAAVAQEALPEIVVEQPSVAQGAAFAGNDIDGEGERGGAVLPPVPSVATTGLAVPLSTTQIDSAEIQSRLPQSSDTAEMLRSAPGVSIFQAGGVSGMPEIGRASCRERV